MSKITFKILSILLIELISLENVFALSKNSEKIVSKDNIENELLDIKEKISNLQENQNEFNKNIKIICLLTLIISLILYFDYYQNNSGIDYNNLHKSLEEIILELNNILDITKSEYINQLKHIGYEHDQISLDCLKKLNSSSFLKLHILRNTLINLYKKKNSTSTIEEILEDNK